MNRASGTTGWWAGATGVVMALVVVAACSGTARVPLEPFYSRAELAPGQAEVRLDVPYRTGPDADPGKHRLDLFLPEGDGWPLLVFVHGGSLEHGDSAWRLLGNDIYRNIGRFYAAHGVGVALVNYRLQPEVDWPAQVDDVAAATAWLMQRARRLGSDGRIYLSGHSAGAWLTSRVALDERVLDRHGLAMRDIAGVISVSGSGFDLTDEHTWKMFGRLERWRGRFSVGPSDADWKRRASIVPLVDGEPAPPFLLLYASDEYPALERQNRLFCAALRRAGQRCGIEEIEGLGHRRMVLALSRPDGPTARRVLAELGAGRAR